MKSLPLSEAKDRLSALVDEAESTHEIVTITKHGRPAAVLMAAEDLESLHETLFWLSQPGVRDAVAEADQEQATGATVDSAQLQQSSPYPSGEPPGRVEQSGATRSRPAATSHRGRGDDLRRPAVGGESAATQQAAAGEC
ncbi:MAG TPA: type II toxin-antitoxin system Phd/YefM family antitoxin [Propionibacteriaceae bacterium]